MAYQSRRNQRIFLIFLLPVMAVLFLTTLYPMLYAGWLSFRNYDLAKPFIPRIFVGWANYAEVLSSGPFLHALITTCKLMAITLSVQLVLGVGIALLVTQKLPGMGIARTLLLIPMMISPVIVGLVWLFLYFPELGYLNYFLSLVGIDPVGWITTTDWALIAVMGLGPLGAAFFLWDKALKLGDARQIGILSYLTPLASTVLLLVVSGRALTPGIALAAAMIIGSALVGTRAKPGD